MSPFNDHKVLSPAYDQAKLFAEKCKNYSLDNSSISLSGFFSRTSFLENV